MAGGSLTLVGTGHRLGSQLTPEVEGHIRNADRVFHLFGDALAKRWLERLNPSAATLVDCYREGRLAYAAVPEMTERVMRSLREGARVCVAFPGHPSILVPPERELRRRARSEGHTVSCLPGVSALDCLVADLGIDPGADGWQVFDTTDFLVQRRRFDPASPLVLLQSASIGQQTYAREHPRRAKRLEVLSEVLREAYPDEHEVVLYETFALAVCEPRVERIPLERLHTTVVTNETTLYVAPLATRSEDTEMLARLGLRPRTDAGGDRGASTSGGPTPRPSSDRRRGGAPA